MPEAICDTSPLQYLYQIGHLNLLHQLAGRVFVPPAVIEELNAGRKRGVMLPQLSILDWVIVKRPAGINAIPLIPHLGKGESEVLLLGLEMPKAVLILDDRLARRMAKSLELPYTGTLGILLNAKRKGLISEVRPLLDELQQLRFRISPHTFQAVLKLANE